MHWELTLHIVNCDGEDICSNGVEIILEVWPLIPISTNHTAYISPRIKRLELCIVRTLEVWRGARFLLFRVLNTMRDWTSQWLRIPFKPRPSRVSRDELELNRTNSFENPDQTFSFYLYLTGKLKSKSRPCQRQLLCSALWDWATNNFFENPVSCVLSVFIDSQDRAKEMFWNPARQSMQGRSIWVEPSKRRHIKLQTNKGNRFLLILSHISDEGHKHQGLYQLSWCQQHHHLLLGRQEQAPACNLSSFWRFASVSLPMAWG